MAKTLTRSEASSSGFGVDAEAAKRLLSEMILIVRLEEKAAEEYALGKIGGFLHLYIGEEAVAVGATSALRPDDYAISAYREHGHCLAKGSDPKRMMAELYGRRDGLSKGKGGSMHLFDRSTNFLGGHAIVGAHLPIAVRVALLAVREAVSRAVARTRQHKTPALIEADTYRYRGHSMRDPAGAVYRTKEEVEREKLRDPIALFRDKILGAGLLSEADIRAVEKDVNDRIDEAVAFADASPEPPGEWLFTDIYKEP